MPPYAFLSSNLAPCPWLEGWADTMGPMTKDAAFELLDAYFAAGGNFFDTSNGYQNEESEKWLGEWMELRGVRDRCGTHVARPFGWYL